MIEELKILLGDAAANFTDAQIGLVLKRALAEVEAYCGRTPDYEMQSIAVDIALIKLNRLGSEGLTAQNFSGVSESYLNDYTANILSALNRKRLIKVV